MLRVPGTWNTRTNSPVRIIHDGEITTVREINKGLSYVREQIKEEKKIVPPDLSKLLQEYKKDYEEFMKFCDELDKALAEGKRKSKARKKTTGSKKKSQTESGLSPEEKKRHSENLARARENFINYYKRLSEAEERIGEEALTSGNIIPDNRQVAYKEFIAVSFMVLLSSLIIF